MPLKATESGKITHNLSPGTVISAGDLLASLELKDPSKVKKIINFDGTLDVAESDLGIEPKETVSTILPALRENQKRPSKKHLKIFRISKQHPHMLPKF